MGVSVTPLLLGVAFGAWNRSREEAHWPRECQGLHTDLRRSFGEFCLAVSAMRTEVKQLGGHLGLRFGNLTFRQSSDNIFRPKQPP